MINECDCLSSVAIVNGRICLDGGSEKLECKAKRCNRFICT